MQSAIFRYHTNKHANVSYRTVAEAHNISIGQLFCTYKKWCAGDPAEPQSAADVVVPAPSVGRKTAFNDTEEDLLHDVALEFVKRHTPLTKQVLCEAAEHLIEKLPESRRTQIKFKHSTPTVGWASAFVARHSDLKIKTIQVIEDRRIAAITPIVCVEHTSRLKAVINKWNIRDPRRIFNIDQTGCNFARQTGRSLRRGIGTANGRLVQTLVRTRGKLTNITVMPCVSADGSVYKPAVVLPGKQVHYRRSAVGYQSPIDLLPPCYLYYRDPAGVDSDIFFNWAHHFVNENAHLRQNGEYCLLVLDGYSAHVQYRTLQYLLENRIIVVAMPAHSSHRLQPLDVGVFGPFKSELQREIHTAARVHKVIDMFCAV